MNELIGRSLEVWASIFANHPVVRTTIGFAHVGGLLAGGGCSIFADRTIIKTSFLAPEARAPYLQGLKGIHGIVVAGLATIIASGLLLLASDPDTYLHSWLFWTKMGLTALLIFNGAFLIRAERSATSGSARAWPRLVVSSVVSVFLWFLTTLAGSGLLNI
jgi:hypothetical protein